MAKVKFHHFVEAKAFARKTAGSFESMNTREKEELLSNLNDFVDFHDTVDEEGAVILSMYSMGGFRNPDYCNYISYRIM